MTAKEDKRLYMLLIIVAPVFIVAGLKLSTII